MTSEPDSLLLSQFVRTHDPVAFDQLARRYRGMVFSIARRVTQSHHDAEDVAQSCFLELARKAASIRVSIPAFLHATATRRAIDVLRDHQRRRRHEQRAAGDRPEPVAIDPAERSWDEISPEVDQAIDRLPDDLKSFIILYFLRGLSIPDIALETGLNRGIVERRLQVGIRRLRADLAKGDRIVSAGMLAIGLKAGASTVVPASLTAATGRMALAAGLNRPGVAKARRLPFRLPGWIAPTGAILATAGVIGFGVFHWRSSGSTATAYDEMLRLYGSALPDSEVSGFSMHAAQMRTDASSFWRGSQPLFFEWCKSNCPDWLADTTAYTLCHASPNLEDAERLCIFVNSDDSARLPAQIELLQGMIIASLATDREIGAGGAETNRLASEVCRAYRESLLQDGSVSSPGTAAAANVATGPTELERIGAERYLDASGNFKSVVLGRQNKVLEFLRPSPLDLARVQSIVSQAVSRNKSLRAICGTADPRVRAVRACVRHESVVTQGQLLLLVQLDGTGQLLELRQQISAAAELAGAVPRDSRCPAQRAAEDAVSLSMSQSAPISWCQCDGVSFTAAPLDLRPPVYELRKDRWVDALQAGRSWAVATAATHRGDPHRAALAALINPALESQLTVRCEQYLQAMQRDLRQFTGDSRVAGDRAGEDALAASWLNQAQPGADLGR